MKLAVASTNYNFAHTPHGAPEQILSYSLLRLFVDKPHVNNGNAGSEIVRSGQHRATGEKLWSVAGASSSQRSLGLGWQAGIRSHWGQ
jgi:hypothetical protein